MSTAVPVDEQTHRAPVRALPELQAKNKIKMSERIIRFRGRRLDNGEWVYGDLLHPIVDVEVIGAAIYKNGRTVNGRFDVDPATVGQDTGFIDKNKDEIYEGDIIKGACEAVGDVIFGNYGWSVDYGGGDIWPLYDELRAGCVEIIGNIYDNPELLDYGDEEDEDEEE